MLVGGEEEGMGPRVDGTGMGTGMGACKGGWQGAVPSACVCPCLATWGAKGQGQAGHHRGVSLAGKGTRTGATVMLLPSLPSPCSTSSSSKPWCST